MCKAIIYFDSQQRISILANQHFCTTIITSLLSFDGRVIFLEMLVNETERNARVQYPSLFEWNIILPSSSFLPMLIPLLSAHRKFLDCSSLNRQFRLYMRSDVYEIGESRLREYETRWRRKRFRSSFRCRFVIRCYPYYVLRMFVVAKKKLLSAIRLLFNLFFTYVSFISNLHAVQLISFCSTEQTI